MMECIPSFAIGSIIRCGQLFCLLSLFVVGVKINDQHNNGTGAGAGTGIFTWSFPTDNVVNRNRRRTCYYCSSTYNICAKSRNSTHRLQRNVFYNTNAFVRKQLTWIQQNTIMNRSSSSPLTRIYMQRNNDENYASDNDDEDNHLTLVDKYTPLLNQRLSHLQARVLEQQMMKPPNPSFSPIQFITVILQELLQKSHKHKHINNTDIYYDDDDDNLPESGFRTLVRSSTEKWKEQLWISIGADKNTGLSEDQLVSALSSAMSRPNNQYEILVSTDYGNNHHTENYHLYFPNDVYEYDEKKAWVESQLRHPKTGKLLAILAWSLVQRESDDAWLIDWLDWQDFRDEFRPGIGREEWPRICG